MTKTKQNDWEEVGGEFNPSWNGKDSDLQEGDEVQGMIIDIREDVGPHKSKIYVIEKGNGEKFDVWGSTVLDTRLKNVDLDYEVKIIYKGKVDSGKGNPYKDYEVFKRKRS